MLPLAMLLSMAASAQTINAKYLIDKMLTNIDQVKSLKVNLNSKERFGDKYIETRMFMKVNQYPFKYYMKDYDKGIELLYSDGWNGGKCYINPNGFPWTNVSLAPLSDKVRADQHHTLFEASFRFLGNILRSLLKRVADEKRNYDTYFKYMGEITYNGRQYYQLYLVNDEFAWVDYTLTQDETPRDLGMRMNLSDHLIEERNGIGHGKLKAGKTIKIPNTYAKKVVLYLDKNSFLPVIQFVYDDKGLYEKYEYNDLIINPTFAADEFTDTFKDYGF